MKNPLMIAAALSLITATTLAQASVGAYNVTTTWYEPDTQPNNSIFIGSFDYDMVTHAVTNLQGVLSESMDPAYNMTWLALGYQLASWHDATLGGTFAAAFAKNSTATFFNNTWTPEDGVTFGGTFAGYTSPFTWAADYKTSIQNAYALIFVPDSPLAALTQPQLNKLAYADCTPGGMMGPTCMTGTSATGYGNVGTMSGYPISQTITAAPVPEPETYALMLAGLGMVGAIIRRRRG